MNKIFLSGNLTRDFEVKESNGKTFARSAIAVKRLNDTDFFNIVAFGKSAEFCEKYLEKGRRVIIEGRLQSSNYTDKNGVKHTDFSVIVENIEFADSKKKVVEESAPEDDVDLPF